MNPLIRTFAAVWAAASAVGSTLHAQDLSPASKDLPKVLLLGDSISIGYTALVQDLMKDKARVVRPTQPNRPGTAENCEGTHKGAQAIDRWLQIDGGHWQVIHFNFGLHDLKHVDPKTRQNSNNSADPHQADPATYEKQLRAIVAQLKRSGAKLIFATTTPVPEGGVKPYRDPQDVILYNTIAAAIMKENDIAVNDLHAFILPDLKRLQQPVNVHFTRDGSRALAREVARHIEAALGERQAESDPSR